MHNESSVVTMWSKKYTLITISSGSNYVRWMLKRLWTIVEGLSENNTVYTHYISFLFLLWYAILVAWNISELKVK